MEGELGELFLAELVDMGFPHNRHVQGACCKGSLAWFGAQTGSHQAHPCMLPQGAQGAGADAPHGGGAGPELAHRARRGP